MFLNLKPRNMLQSLLLVLEVIQRSGKKLILKAAELNIDEEKKSTQAF